MGDRKQVDSLGRGMVKAGVVVDVLINNFVDGRNACYMSVVPPSASSGSVYMVDDAGDGNYAAGSPLGLPSSGAVSNTHCTISGTGSSVSASGNTLKR